MATETSTILQSETTQFFSGCFLLNCYNHLSWPGEVNSTTSSPVLKVPERAHLVVRVRCWLLLSISVPRFAQKPALLCNNLIKRFSWRCSATLTPAVVGGVSSGVRKNRDWEVLPSCLLLKSYPCLVFSYCLYSGAKEYWQGNMMLLSDKTVLCFSTACALKLPSLSVLIYTRNWRTIPLSWNMRI